MKLKPATHSARPLKMWVVVVRSPTSEWMDPRTLDPHKREAWAKYQELFPASQRVQCDRELSTGLVRLARVTTALS